MSMNEKQQSRRPLFGTDRDEKQPVPDNAVFDEETFLEYVGNDVVLARRVVHRFLADSPGRVAEIGTALCAGNAPMLERASHTLKGTVVFLAAPAVVDAVRQLETLARASDFPQAVAAFIALEREMPRLTSALKAFLACTSR